MDMGGGQHQALRGSTRIRRFRERGVLRVWMQKGEWVWMERE